MSYNLGVVMPRLRASIACTVAAVAALTFVAGTPVARADPATSVAATQIAPLGDGEIADLIGKLSAGSWRERQAAQARLVQLGERARPHLEALLNGPANALDDETRNRAATTVQQIDDAARTGPSLVTLHVREA